MNIPEELLPVVEWWEKDGKKTLAIVGVAGVVALAIWAFNARRERAKDAAADALAASVSASRQVHLDPQGAAAQQAIADLVQQLDAHGDSATGPLMKLVLAADYCARRGEGDLENALEIYEALVVPGATPDAYADIPFVGKAECLEALGRFDEARAAFEGFEESHPLSTLKAAAKLGVARCLAQSGDKVGAIAHLEALKASATDDEKPAIEMTLQLVKRWVPASSRRPAPPPPAAPAAEEASEEPVADAVDAKAAVTDAIQELASPEPPASEPAPADPAAPVPEAPAAE